MDGSLGTKISPPSMCSMVYMTNPTACSMVIQNRVQRSSVMLKGCWFSTALRQTSITEPREPMTLP